MSPLDHLAPRRRGMLLVVAAALLWSSGGLFIKILDQTPFQINAFRSLAAALTVLAVMRRRRAPWSLSLDPLSLACCACYAGTLILFVAATKLTTAANAIFLQYSAPAFLLFLEPWALRLPFPRRDLGAVAVCMGGLALFFAGHLEAGHTLGNVLGLVSGVTLALFTLLLKMTRVRHPEQSPYALVVAGNLLVALVCVPLALPHLHLTWTQGAILAYLGVFQLGLSWALFTAGTRYLSATAAVLTGTLEAVFNPVWVYLGIGERPSGFALLGGLVVLGTVLWYNLGRSPRPAR